MGTIYFQLKSAGPGFHYPLPFQTFVAISISNVLLLLSLSQEQNGLFPSDPINSKTVSQASWMPFLLEPLEENGINIQGEARAKKAKSKETLNIGGGAQA